MKNIIFETKEEYLELKKNWATYFNTEARHLDRDADGYKTRKLTASHFVLYALIRGRDWKSCLHSCSQDTMDEVTSNLKGNWFYQTKIFKEIFNFSDGRIALIKHLAVNFPNTERRLEAIRNEKAEITQVA